MAENNRNDLVEKEIQEVKEISKAISMKNTKDTKALVKKKYSNADGGIISKVIKEKKICK